MRYLCWFAAALILAILPSNLPAQIAGDTIYRPGLDDRYPADDAIYYPDRNPASNVHPDRGGAGPPFGATGGGPFIGPKIGPRIDPVRPPKPGPDIGGRPKPPEVPKPPRPTVETPKPPGSGPATKVEISKPGKAKSDGGGAKPGGGGGGGKGDRGGGKRGK
jgi:translation initiation factor IF-2